MSKLNLQTIKIELNTDDDKTIKQVVISETVIAQIVKDCFILDVEKKQVEKKLKAKKSELKALLMSFNINKIMASNFTMTRTSSKKFSKWTDEEAVMNMIPKKLRGLTTMTPSKSKIEALITTNDLPESIMDLAKSNPVETIKFVPAVEKILTD